MQTQIETTPHDRREAERTRATDREAAILHVIEAMVDLYQYLPEYRLAHGERKSCATNMLGQASRLVRSMARVLVGYPEALTEAQEDPAELVALQNEADLLKLLRAHLYLLFIITNDAYLDTQSQAVARVRAALRRLRVSARHLYREATPQRILREALIARVAAFDPRGKRDKGTGRKTR